MLPNLKHVEEKIQKLTDECIKHIDELLAKKEKELLSI
ncbi:ribosome recycling factor [Streptobacillus moniliformis]